MKVIAGRGALRSVLHLTSILGRYCFFILATASSKYIAEIHYAMCRYSTCEAEEKAPPPCTLTHSHSHTHKKRSMLMLPLERERVSRTLFLAPKAQHNVYFRGKRGGAGGKLPHAKIRFDYFSRCGSLANGIH